MVLFIGNGVHGDDAARPCLGKRPRSIGVPDSKIRICTISPSGTYSRYVKKEHGMRDIFPLVACLTVRL